MTRIPEGEPQLTRQQIDEELSIMAQDPHYLETVHSIQRDFATSDSEVEELMQNYERFYTGCSKAVKGFEAFCLKNDLENLEPTVDPTKIVRMVDLGGGLHPTIRLTLTSGMDDDLRFLSEARNINVVVEVGADDGGKFMPPKPISEFHIQIGEVSLRDIGSEISLPLENALITARSITEADLTESRPVLPSSRE